ncbi:MAG: LTA synthase family protein, partial [Bacillota bacterium]|nr:LTA synthase family protein [Bacillota bacterium]
MLKTSLPIKNQKENKFINIIIKLLNYLLDDKMTIIVFISLVFESVLFVGIIKNSGASVYKFNLNNLLYGNTRIVIFFSLAFISFSFLFTKRIHWFFLVITNTLYSILIIADLWYYRGFQDFLSIHTLGESQNLHNLSRAVFSMARTIDLIFVFDIIIVLILALLLRKKWNVVRRKKIMFLIVLCYPVIMLTILHCKCDFNDDNYTGQVLFKTQYMPYATMENLTPIGYHFYDIVMYINDNRIIKLTKKDESLIKQWLNYKNEDLPDNEYKGVFKGKNLIFIQVESLENFVINQKYDGQAVTPNLNNLIKNSYYFPNFYEQVNNGNSGDADLMANASVLPVRRGSTFFRFPKNNYNTLPQILKNNNYYSRSLHASDGAIWNISTALKSFGFDNSKDMYDFKNSETFWMGLTDEEFFSQVSDLMNSDSKPFYY